MLISDCYLFEIESIELTESSLQGPLENMYTIFGRALEKKKTQSFPN